MTMVSDDPAWWPSISAYRFSSYFFVAAFVGVIYDWALTFGQEVELIWRQHWSLMTVLYLSVRYLGILSVTMYMLLGVPTILLSDTECFIMYMVWNSTVVVVFAMLQVIIITRLHAMYQRLRKILIFLIVTFLAASIFNGVTIVMMTVQSSGEELILSGAYQCQINYTGDTIFLTPITWILAIVWEVVALCLAVWIAVQHFRELRQHSAKGIIRDCFMVLIKTHVVHFTSFVVVSCFELISDYTPTLSTPHSLGAQIFEGFVQILQVAQIFVLGPRLILGIREYHAKLVADADAATSMTSIVFQERVHISTGSSV